MLKDIMSGRNGTVVIALKRICDGLEMGVIEFFNTLCLRI